METILLVVHLIIAVALVIIVLLQRSEGGGLGMGSSGGMGNYLSARAAGNVLTKATAVLAAGFIATSLILAILASSGGSKSKATLEQMLQQEVPASETAPVTLPEGTE